MTIVADILDFLFVFLPVALLTHLAFKIGLAQGRSKGGTSLFVGTSTVAFSFLFKIYFDIVFGSTDSFWLFLLTFVTSIGLILAFIGTSRAYSFLIAGKLRGSAVLTKQLKAGILVAIVYSVSLVTYMFFVHGPSYVRFGAICYVINQVLLFCMVLLVAEIISLAEKPFFSGRVHLLRFLSAYYLIEPIVWVLVVLLQDDFHLPIISRLFINSIGVSVSCVVAIILFRFVRQHLQAILRQMRTTYLDTLRVNVLRDLYLIGSGLTVFMFVVLLVAESFYEDLRISTLRSFAESRSSLIKLSTANVTSTLQEVASRLQRTSGENDAASHMTSFMYAHSYIDAVGSLNQNGRITFLKRARPTISDSEVLGLLKEVRSGHEVNPPVLPLNGAGVSGPELVILAGNDERSNSEQWYFGIVNIEKALSENVLDTNDFRYRYKLLSPSLVTLYSSEKNEIGVNFEDVMRGKNHFRSGDLSNKIAELRSSGFDGYEILRGANRGGVGEYYILVTSPLEIQNNKWILASLEREERISQLFQPTNSLLILAGLLVMGLFGGGLVLISVSFKWSLRLEKEVQNKIQELRSSEDKYRRIVENPYFGSFISVDGRLIFSNTRLSGIFETSVEQLSGTDLSSFISGKDLTLLNNIFESIITGEKSGDKWQVEGKSGSGRRIRLSGYSSIINIGNKRGVQSVVVDSTSDLKEKEKLEQFERLESMATLAAGIAHDFNNILQIVLGSSQLLQHKLTNPDLQKYADNITKVAIRGSDLSKRLLTFSRQKGLEERKIFDVNSLVIESLQVFEETFPRTIKIETQLNSEPVYVEGDQSQLQQVFFNLAVNARDAMPHGGTLSIRTEIRETSTTEAEIYQVAQGKYVFIMVKDNGEGIPPELMTKVFEPFFTTKEPGRGTGLGLSVVYGIVRSHKGYLKVYSELNKGTAFNIYLPLASISSMKVTQPRRVKERVSPFGKRILFVDDEEGIREAAQFLLEQEGYSVITAKDGMNAIEIFRREWRKINLVVLDLNMPELSGREVLDNLFIVNPDVRVLISTGYITPDERVGLRGVVEVIEKPFDFDQLIEKVRIGLEERGPVEG